MEIGRLTSPKITVTNNSHTFESCHLVMRSWLIHHLHNRATKLGNRVQYFLRSEIDGSHLAYQNRITKSKSKEYFIRWDSTLFIDHTCTHDRMFTETAFFNLPPPLPHQTSITYLEIRKKWYIPRPFHSREQQSGRQFAHILNSHDIIRLHTLAISRGGIRFGA